MGDQLSKKHDNVLVVAEDNSVINNIAEQYNKIKGRVTKNDVVFISIGGNDILNQYNLFNVDDDSKLQTIFKNYKNPSSLVFLNEDIMESDLQNASLIVVNYLIQFLDLEERDILFKKIFKALIPNGILILSEKVHYENKFENQRIINTHHLFKSANGYSDLEISGKRDSLEGILKTECEEEHILRARKAGFIKAEKILSNLNFRTFVFSK